MCCPSLGHDPDLTKWLNYSGQSLSTSKVIDCEWIARMLRCGILQPLENSGRDRDARGRGPVSSDHKYVLSFISMHCLNSILGGVIDLTWLGSVGCRELNWILVTHSHRDVGKFSLRHSGGRCKCHVTGYPELYTLQASRTSGVFSRVNFCAVLLHLPGSI